MTQQATAPAPPPQQPTAAATPSAAAATQQDAHTEWLRADTPRLLNRLQVLAVTACVLFGVVAALLQVLAWQANGRAADNTEQVVRVQEIESLMLRADALATNSFLVGGLEPVEARAEYDDAINRVLALITDAADAQPADRAALARLSAKVSEYTNAVTQARDYNRQQLPIAIAYLNNASRQDLRRRRSLLDPEHPGGTRHRQHPACRGRDGRATTRGCSSWSACSLWWRSSCVNRLIAQRFRRRFNVGLVVAAVVVGVLTLITSLHASSSQRCQRRDPSRALPGGGRRGRGPHRSQRREGHRGAGPHQPRLGSLVRDQPVRPGSRSWSRRTPRPARSRSGSST